MRRSSRGNHERTASRSFLSGLGDCQATTFVPSPFQLRAIAELQKKDVLVVAPTGSGKTYIAEKIFSAYLKEEKRCWYTTPLKALSNQKFEAFQRIFGEQNVGLVTGERKIRQEAPIIVATTEVLRNLLYTGERTPDLAVLDEIHFLADPDRGVTWEEILILSPPSLRLLMLSATVSNHNELSSWLRRLGRGKPAVILEQERTVPLKVGFLNRSYRPLPLSEERSEGRKRRRQPLQPGRLLQSLMRDNLLPAIVFLNRRADCDRQALRCEDIVMRERQARQQFVQSFLREHPFLENYPYLRALVQAGVAPHHAGHITAWKICVERMLKESLLLAVFATTTLAAGLDVPARSVVLPTLWLRDKKGRRHLTSTEFHQMTGRAGRRGRDKIGFVLLLSSGEVEKKVALELMRSPAEPIVSSFRVSYYQILNLLDQKTLADSLLFLEKSFALYQKARRTHHGAERLARRLRKEFLQRADLLREKGYLNSDHTLTELGHVAKEIRQERCLYIVESIKAGLWEGLSAEEVAGVAAMFTTERAPREKVGSFQVKPFFRCIRNLEREQMEKKIDEPFSADPKYALGDAKKKTSALRAFAEGIAFEELIRLSESEEGDLQRLILRTYELLQELEHIPSLLSEKIKRVKPKLYRYPIVD